MHETDIDLAALQRLRLFGTVHLRQDDLGIRVVPLERFDRLRQAAVQDRVDEADTQAPGETLG
ncbi:hypothetical protein D3C81_2229430 [compost metagenome]